MTGLDYGSYTSGTSPSLTRPLYYISYIIVIKYVRMAANWWSELTLVGWWRNGNRWKWKKRFCV